MISYGNSTISTSSIITTSSSSLCCAVLVGAETTTFLTERTESYLVATVIETIYVGNNTTSTTAQTLYNTIFQTDQELTYGFTIIEGGYAANGTSLYVPKLFGSMAKQLYFPCLLED